MYLIYSDLPQEIVDRLVAIAKEKLPDADEAVLKEMIAQHMQVVKDYIISQN